MSRRANAALRCPRCRMHRSLCICALIPRLVTRTHLILVIHRYEDRKPTNTGRLAAECLSPSVSQVVVRGHEASPGDLLAIAPRTRPVLLFPHEGARDLRDVSREHPDQPMTLIVPDGTWRQASKVRQRVQGLDAVPCVGLPLGRPSTYRLRAESRDAGLATIEAVARALGILEGPHVEDAMLRVFGAMVERTLWARGEIEAREVTDGLPAGAERHDPTSGGAPHGRAVPLFS